METGFIQKVTMENTVAVQEFSGLRRHMQWFKDVQNILGLIFIVASGAVMIVWGHNVFGMAFNIPVAVFPMCFGFLMLSTRAMSNAKELKADITGQSISGYQPTTSLPQDSVPPKGP